jgi:hypothetical protein
MAFKLADIFLTDDEQDLRDGGVLTFEISEHQGESLKTLVGKPEQFLLDSSHGFWGELLKLERCDSTISWLCVLEKPVMRGVLRVHKIINGGGRAAPN